MAVAGMPAMFAHAATTADNATQPTFTEWHDLSVNNVNRFRTLRSSLTRTVKPL